jgi:hypothetical protein
MKAGTTMNAVIASASANPSRMTKKYPTARGS